MVTILISAALKIRRLFQCGYPKEQRLFEAWRLLTEVQYVKLITNTNK